MIILTPAAEVKPATINDTFPLAYRDEYQVLEADARDMFDDMSDEEIDAMADESACYASYESGLTPW